MTKSPYTNANNVFLTRDLFYETALNKDNVVYTLKNQDHAGYPSLYRLYMETMDPTEYSFAQDHLGGWDHWQTLCNTTWFKDYADKWRSELEVKIRSMALAQIMEKANGDNREAFAAAKYIADGYGKGSGSTRGRPSKAEIARNAREMVDSRNRTNEDWERIQGNS